MKVRNEMSTRNTKIAHCPNCCPDGGACFTAAYGRDATGENPRPVWRCNNCWHEMPRRSNRRDSAKLTKSQAVVVDSIARNFGVDVAAVEVEFIGRTVYVKATNEGRGWHNGTMLAGIIGPTGKMELTLYRLGGDYKITKPWDLTSYAVTLKTSTP